jgi:hypothetical protein
MATVYALLVGIDRYRPPLQRLFGAGNDIRDVESYLGEVPAADVRVRTLRDGEATLDGVVTAFTDHLGQAGAGDSALFWFSGHGSTCPVPPSLWHAEPSGELQTLVCADSRHGGVPDLVDKDLAVLVDGVAGRGAHVVVVLDCCHSSGATRSQSWPEVRRWAPPAQDAAGWPFPAQSRGALREAAVPVLKGGPDHVALAACRSYQSAGEWLHGNEFRGAFSLALLIRLRRAGPLPTYRELLTAARCQVEDRAGDQCPVLYPGDAPIVDQPFLGGLARPAATTMIMRRVGGAWQVDAGLCHGLVASADATGGYTANAAVGDAADAAGGDTAVAVHGSSPPQEARVVEVRATSSRVEPSGWQPDPDRQYPVVLARVPLPLTTVAILTEPEPDPGSEPGSEPEPDPDPDPEPEPGSEPGPAAAARLAAAVAQAGPGGGPSPHVRVLSAGDGAARPDLVIGIGPAGTPRILGADGLPVVPDVPDVPDTDPQGVARVVARLEHIACWRLVKGLSNPLSRLAAAVRVDVVPALPGDSSPPLARRGLRAGPDGRIGLEYARVNGGCVGVDGECARVDGGPPSGDGWVPPRVFVQLRNTTTERLFCVLLDLTDRFRIDPGLFPGGFVGPGVTATAGGGQAVHFTLPAGRPVLPGAAVDDWLLLVVAEDEVDSRLFALPALGEPMPGASRGGVPVRGLVERLGLAAVERGTPAPATAAGDWWTCLAPVTTRVPGGDPLHPSPGDSARP